MSNIQELRRTFDELFGDIPQCIRHWVAQDELSGHQEAGPSLVEIYRKTREDVIVLVIGGTFLEHGMPKDQRLYYHLNRDLAELFVKQKRADGKLGWSFLTGMGPGKAMAGPHYCLQEYRKASVNCQSKCLAVPSGLDDEPRHTFSDQEYTVRGQADSILREMFLVALADAVIVYPGFRGTRMEYSVVDFINYVAGRSAEGFPKKPVVMVDMPSVPNMGIEFDGGSFFAPYSAMRKHAERIGVSKPGLNEDHQVVNLTWPNAAQQIVAHLQHGLERLGKLPQNGNGSN